MDKIVDHLFIFRGEGIVEDFPGNYSDFRTYEDSQPVISENSNDKKEKKSWKKDNNNTLSYNEQKEYKNIESKLKSLEFDKKTLEGKFHDENLSPDDINALSDELQTLITAIETKEERWLELMSKMEE